AGVAAALAMTSAATEARATLTLSTNITRGDIQHDATGVLNTTVSALDCATADDAVNIPIELTGVIAGTTLEIWASYSSDCTAGTDRVATNSTCKQIDTKDWGTTKNKTISISSKEL